jgi:hypothetical protein
VATEQEIKKSIETMVDEALGTELNKAERPAEHEEANSGEPGKPADKIKSGSPKTEKQAMEAKKKIKKAEETSEEENSEEVVEKSAKEEAAEKKETKKIADKEAKQEVASHEKDMHKSLEAENTIGTLDEEEQELIKAWRASKEEEIITKSQTASEEATEELTKAVREENTSLKKSLTEQSELIKSLTEKVEKIASQPAYDKRSLSTLEPLEKSETSNVTDVSKGQVADKMLELQLAGEGVTSKDIGEFEATGNISNPTIKRLVMDSFKTK